MATAKKSTRKTNKPRKNAPKKAAKKSRKNPPRLTAAETRKLKKLAKLAG